MAKSQCHLQTPSATLRSWLQLAGSWPTVATEDALPSTWMVQAATPAATVVALRTALMAKPYRPARAPTHATLPTRAPHSALHIHRQSLQRHQRRRRLLRRSLVLHLPRRSPTTRAATHRLLATGALITRVGISESGQSTVEAAQPLLPSRATAAAHRLSAAAQRRCRDTAGDGRCNGTRLGL